MPQKITIIDGEEQIKATHLRNKRLAKIDPTNGQVLVYNDATGEYEPGSNGIPTFATQAKFYYVSGSRGSDLTGDGSIYNCYATIQKAITEGLRGLSTYCSIIVDETTPRETITIPSIKTVYLTSLMGPDSDYVSIDLQLNPGSSFKSDSVIIKTLTELGAPGTRYLWLEEGRLEGTITAPSTFLYVSSTLIAKVDWDASTYFQTEGSFTELHPTDGYKIKALNGIDNNNKNIVNVLDPINPQDAATRNYVDGKLTIGSSLTTYFVSGANGDDTNGDGSIYKPFETIQKAVDVGILIGTEVEITIDISCSGDSFTAPAGKMIFIHGGFGPQGAASVSVVLEDTSFIMTDNIILDIDGSGLGIGETATLMIEEGGISSCTNTNRIRLWGYDTRTTPMVDISNCVKYGTFLNSVGELLVESKLYANKGIRLGSNRTQITPQTLAGAVPVNADVASWDPNDSGIGIGTGGRIFLMFNNAGVVKYVEMS